MVIANIQRRQPRGVPNVRKWDWHDPRAKFDDVNEVESENEDEQISKALVGWVIEELSSLG